MITDDPQDMEQKLTQYVKDARQALETLEELEPIEHHPHEACSAWLRGRALQPRHSTS